MKLSDSTSPIPRIRTVIVDDEPTARRGVRLLLKRDAMFEVVAEVANGLEAVEVIERERPDLVFLDVQMPGLCGFEVLNKLGKDVPPAVIFVTAHDAHALRAFEVNAIDYLLKPYDDTRFYEALERVKKSRRHESAEAESSRMRQLLDFVQSKMSSGQSGADTDRILVKSSGDIYFLKADEIDWIEAEGDYMKFHTGEKSHLMRETMARLEARLDGKRFIRIHRSTIVNIDRLRKLSPSFGGEYAVVLEDGTKLKLSRGYHDRIAELLK